MTQSVASQVEAGPTTEGDGGSGDLVLRLRDVSRYYGGIRAVDGVTFAVARGERRAVIGPNGAGKTTLFKLISREEACSEGSVEFLGRDITRVPAYRVAKLGMSRTYQITRVFPALSVLENVILACQALQPGSFQMLRSVMRRRSIIEQAELAIETVGLGAVTRSPASELGHGEQRQLELGIALSQEPTLLLLDEPAAGLSAAERGLMRELMRNLPEDMTVLLIEHDMELALGLADYVTCLNNGSQVAEGTPEEIKNDERVRNIYLGKGD